MCFAMMRPVSVVLWPIRWSKNLQPGLRIAPYSELRLIFLTSCLLSQNAVSSEDVAAFFLACISLRSAYHLSNNPGIIPFTSYLNIVPLALRVQGWRLSNTKRHTSAADIISLDPSCQSRVISVPCSMFITA